MGDKQTNKQLDAGEEKSIELLQYLFAHERAKNDNKDGRFQSTN
jgi:hypothetical protein